MLHFPESNIHHNHTHQNHKTTGGANDNANKKAIRKVFIITFLFFLVEIIGGLITNSLALISDAVHMLSDVASLGLSWLAIIIARRPATAKHTYGMKRAEILAALLNAVTLIVISLFIFKEAWERFKTPPVVESSLMIAIAATGLLVNFLGAWILYRSNPWGNLNMRGAFLHVLGDALGSLGAVAAGVVMLSTGYYIIDPAVSVFIGIIIFIGAARLLNDTVHVLLEGTPGHISYEEVKSAILRTEGVKGVHDLHIWTITSGFEILSAHVITKSEKDQQELLKNLLRLIQNEFNIEHVTIQLEKGSLLNEEDVEDGPCLCIRRT